MQNFIFLPSKLVAVSPCVYLLKQVTVTDVNYTYGGDRLTVYVNTNSTSKTNRMLYLNDIQYKKSVLEVHEHRSPCTDGNWTLLCPQTRLQVTTMALASAFCCVLFLLFPSLFFGRSLGDLRATNN